MEEYIRVTVDIAVFTDPGNDLQVLLIRRGNPPFQDQWALPGGFVDYGESLETAARRELKEEAHIRVNDLIQVGAFGNPK
ncbi:MAG: NUDIX hydrolase, partial [Flavobacteriales bacterium]|nr:NUDIX hydrolase [Flavobacteriales bacterium]